MTTGGCRNIYQANLWLIAKVSSHFKHSKYNAFRLPDPRSRSYTIYSEALTLSGRQLLEGQTTVDATLGRDTEFLFDFVSAIDLLLESPSGSTFTANSPECLVDNDIRTIHCKFSGISEVSTGNSPLIARFMGPTWGPVGPRWVPCWPHELCYLGLYVITLHGNAFRITDPLWGESIGHRWFSLSKD